MVIGHLFFRNLAFNILHEWAKSTFHDSFLVIALIGNGFFEVPYSRKEGTIHAFMNNFFYESKPIIFIT